MNPRSLAIQLHGLGFTVEDIADYMRVRVQQVQAWLS